MTHNPTLFYVAGLLGGIYFGYVVIAGGPAIWSYCGRYLQAHGGTVDKLGVAHRAGAIFMGFALVMVYTINPIFRVVINGFYATLKGSKVSTCTCTNPLKSPKSHFSQP